MTSPFAKLAARFPGAATAAEPVNPTSTSASANPAPAQVIRTAETERLRVNWEVSVAAFAQRETALEATGAALQASVSALNELRDAPFYDWVELGRRWEKRAEFPRGRDSDGELIFDTRWVSCRRTDPGAEDRGPLMGWRQLDPSKEERALLDEIAALTVPGSGWSVARLDGTEMKNGRVRRRADVILLQAPTSEDEYNRRCIASAAEAFRRSDAKDAFSVWSASPSAETAAAWVATVEAHEQVTPGAARKARASGNARATVAAAGFPVP